MDPKTRFPGLSEYFEYIISLRLLEVCMSHQVNLSFGDFLQGISNSQIIFSHEALNTQLQFHC